MRPLNILNYLRLFLFFYGNHFWNDKGIAFFIFSFLTIRFNLFFFSYLGHWGSGSLFNTHAVTYSSSTRSGTWTPVSLPFCFYYCDETSLMWRSFRHFFFLNQEESWSLLNRRDAGVCRSVEETNVLKGRETDRWPETQRERQRDKREGGRYRSLPSNNRTASLKLWGTIGYANRHTGRRKQLRLEKKNFKETFPHFFSQAPLYSLRGWDGN